ncbi:MAG TPA: hypothetical protein VJK25_01670 [Patescibacteria group bacterium]|nr:hypothetical protein [Patescibacteria group bacterium]
MFIKLVKTIGIKMVYLVFFLGLLIFIFFFFFTTFNRYFNSFHLSEEVNRYLESVSLDQLKLDEADRVVEILSPTSSPQTLPADLKDPFEVNLESEEES